jgi:hypothetical protein
MKRVNEVNVYNSEAAYNNAALWNLSRRETAGYCVIAGKLRRVADVSRGKMLSDTIRLRDNVKRGERVGKNNAGVFRSRRRAKWILASYPWDMGYGSWKGNAEGRRAPYSDSENWEGRAVQNDDE